MAHKQSSRNTDPNFDDVAQKIAADQHGNVTFDRWIAELAAATPAERGAAYRAQVEAGTYVEDSHLPLTKSDEELGLIMGEALGVDD